MKKLCFTLLISLIALCGCVRSPKAEKSGDDSSQSKVSSDFSENDGSSSEKHDTPKADIVIKQDIFYDAVTDIYNNYTDYAGKTVTLTGLLDKTVEGSNTYYSVYSYDPTGCCMIGIEIDWSDKWQSALPDDIVTATGTIGTYIENDTSYLIVNLSDFYVGE